MNIRNSVIDDLEMLLQIYTDARQYMRDNENIHQ